MKTAEKSNREWFQSEPETCMVCTHCIRVFIEDDISQGTDIATICRRYNIPSKILIYHQLNHMKKEMT